MRIPTVVFASIVVSVSSLNAQDQQTKVGELKNTKTLTTASNCPEIEGPATRGIKSSGDQRMLLRREGQPVINAGPGTRIVLNDRLSKNSDVLARMDVNADVGGKGTFFLVPTIGCYPGLQGQRFEGEIPYSVSSEYQFGTRSVRRGGGENLQRALALTLDRGSVIVHWRGGKPLAVVLPFDTIQVIGTTVSISVDSAQTSGFVYVHKGTVFIPSLGNLTAGEIARWGGGVAGARPSVERDIEPLKQSTRYYTEQAWNKRGGWLKWAAAAVVAGGVTYCVVEKCFSKDNYDEYDPQQRGIRR